MGHIHDVVVIGAGLAGGSMAFMLASKGWDTLLIDQHTFPRHKVCGEFMSPESQHILSGLGLNRLVESLEPSMIDKVRVISAKGTSLEIPLPGKALGVSRFLLDESLHRAALEKGADVWLGVKVISILEKEDGYTIDIQRGREQAEIKARAIIGAWGRNPRTSVTGNPSRKLSEKSYIGIRVHYELEGLAPKSGCAVELYFFRGGYVGVSPIEGSKYNIAALMTKEAFHLAGKTVRGVIESIAKSNPMFRDRIAFGNPVPDTQAAVAPVIISRKPVAWNLVPQIGDAAVVIPPLCGDGMAMALRSVELCAPLVDLFLREKLTLAEWRQTYSKMLLHEFTGPLRWGSIVQLLLGNRVLLTPLLRIGQRSPGLASCVVRATRLKGRALIED